MKDSAICFAFFSARLTWCFVIRGFQYFHLVGNRNSVYSTSGGMIIQDQILLNLWAILLGSKVYRWWYQYDFQRWHYFVEHGQTSKSNGSILCKNKWLPKVNTFHFVPCDRLRVDHCIILWSSEIMLVSSLIHLLRLTFGFYPKKQGLFFWCQYLLASDTLGYITMCYSPPMMVRSAKIKYSSLLQKSPPCRSSLFIDFTAWTVKESAICFVYFSA